MQVRGTLATRTYGAEPDIEAWANRCALNPARIEPSQRNTPAVQEAAAKLVAVADLGLSRMPALIDGRSLVRVGPKRERPETAPGSEA
jgi:hypothetical protein